MVTFVVRRAAGALATFLLSTVVVFAVAFALPGDPARAIAGRPSVPSSVLVAIRHRYHLDEPLVAQYVRWLAGLLHGDLGESYVARRPVASMLVQALPVTAALLALTLVIEGVLGLVAGTTAGMRRGSRADHATVVLCTIALAAPLFVVAALGQDLFGVRWHLLPVAGTQQGLRSYLLPAITLALSGLAVGTRLARSQTLVHRHGEHVRTAAGKGLTRRAITRRHIVRNGLQPYVTFLGLEIGALAGGSVVVERIFNLPGVGQAVAKAIVQHDNALIVGFAMATVTVYLVVDLVTDVVSMVLDPRLRSARP